jgi:carboxylesterase type B
LIFFNILIRIIFLQLPQNNDKNNKLLDVIVFIHGGAFMFGESEGYGPSKLIDRDVILVTINYRLGPLGTVNYKTLRYFSEFNR